jgi:hypothetical protein
MALLVGCALPLVPATVPLAVVGWGMIASAVLTDLKTERPADEPEPQALMLGQVRRVLTPADVAAGRIDPEGDHVENLGAWLSGLGLTPRQVADGQVVVVQVAVGTPPDGAAPRGLFVPMLRGGVSVHPGDIVEARIRREQPGELVRVRPAGASQGECAFLDLGGSKVPPDRLLNRALGHTKLSATMYCKDIETEGWVRPSAFWVKSPGHLPGAMATLLVIYRPHNRFWADLVLDVTVAEKRFELNVGECRVVLVPAGRRVVSIVSTTQNMPLRRALAVDVAPDDRVAVEFAFDAAGFGMKEPLFRLGNIFSDAETPPQYVRFSARPATPGEICTSRSPPVVVRGF